MLSASEMEDFESTIREAGFDPDDFNPVAVEIDPSTDGVHPVKGTVTIYRESTGHSTTYQAGHGSTWVADFQQDLEQGEFGSP